MIPGGRFFFRVIDQLTNHRPFILERRRCMLHLAAGKGPIAPLFYSIILACWFFFIVSSESIRIPVNVVPIKSCLWNGQFHHSRDVIFQIYIYVSFIYFLFLVLFVCLFSPPQLSSTKKCCWSIDKSSALLGRNYPFFFFPSWPTETSERMNSSLLGYVTRYLHSVNVNPSCAYQLQLSIRCSPLTHLRRENVQLTTITKQATKKTSFKKASPNQLQVWAMWYMSCLGQ